MKKGFTIIELIFIIIILGILAAIAIPKLNASRSDAQVTQSLSNLKIAINDINSFVLAKGELGPSSLMSNVANLQDVDLSKLSGTKELKFKIGDDDDCISLTFSEKDSAFLFGISYDASSLNKLKAIVDARSKLDAKPNDIAAKNALVQANEALYKQDFKKPNAKKICKALLANSSFQNLAKRAYILSSN